MKEPVKIVVNVPDEAVKNASVRIFDTIKSGRVGDRWGAEVSEDDSDIVLVHGVMGEFNGRYGEVSYYSVYDAVLNILEQECNVGDYYLANGVPAWVHVDLLEFIVSTEIENANMKVLASVVLELIFSS